MKEDGKKYVVHGMRAECTEGSMKNYIITDVGHGVVYQGQPLLNANDHTPQVNLTHFGDCHSKLIYEEAKKAADEKYKADADDGFFAKAGKFLAKTVTKAVLTAKEYFGANKCELDTPLPWMFVNKEHMIDGAPALTIESQCACRYGGIIKIVLEEDENVSLPEDEEFEEIKQELLDTIKNEPWNLSKISQLCIELWGTETGNQIEKDIFSSLQGIISPILAFEYIEEEDYYVTNETYGIQRRFGFADIYDDMGYLLGMDLDTEILVFTPEGSEKEYRLQFWKGAYGSGGAYGSEIGLYARDKVSAEKNPYIEGSKESKFTFYSCVSGDDEIRTKQIIKDAKTEDILLVNDTANYAKEDDHFWNLAIRTDPGYTSDDLVIIDTLYIEDDNMRDAIIREINKNDNLILDKENTKEGKIVVQYGRFKKE